MSFRSLKKRLSERKKSPLVQKHDYFCRYYESFLNCSLMAIHKNKLIKIKEQPNESIGHWQTIHLIGLSS